MMLSGGEQLAQSTLPYFVEGDMSVYNFFFASRFYIIWGLDICSFFGKENSYYASMAWEGRIGYYSLFDVL